MHQLYFRSFLVLFIFISCFSSRLLGQIIDPETNHPLYNPPVNETPRLIKNLGSSPQFDELRNHPDETSFFKGLMYYKNNPSAPAADVKELNKLLELIGFKGGLSSYDLDESDIVKIEFPQGTIGMLGNDKHGYIYSKIINEDKKGLIEGFEIKSQNNLRRLFIMSDCGNAFGDLIFSAVVCQSCVDDSTKNPGLIPFKVKITNKFKQDEDRSFRGKISIPIYLKRVLKDTTVRIKYGDVDYFYELDFNVGLDTTMKYVYDIPDPSLTFKDSSIVNIDEEDFRFNYRLKHEFNPVDSTVVEIEEDCPCDDWLLRVSLGSDLETKTRQTGIFSTTLKPYWDLGVGVEKRLGGNWWMAVDGLIGFKRIEEEAVIVRDLIQLDIPDLFYLGLSSSFMYNFDNWKVGLGPRFLTGINTTSDPNLDFSYGIIGFQSELAYRLKSWDELFIQLGMNNHKYRNYNVGKFLARIGTKFYID